MKKLVLGLMFLVGCGYSSVDNELIGQVKKVKHMTPIVCYDYSTADVSLGIMRNGVGSLSNQDVWLTVPEKLEEEFKKANESGAIVKIKYKEWRATLCIPEYEATSIEIVP